METGPPTIDTILCEAVEIESAAEREAFLDEACGEDAELRHRVEKLIADHFLAGDFLEDSPVAFAASIDQPGAEQPGQTIGRYKLLQEIGEGGFGVVYMAEQTEPVRRQVALKIIKLGMDTKQVIARFEAERQALAMMDHPNIAKVHDAGATETGRPYFVMELVRGIPISEYCDQHRLTMKDRLKLFINVCHAVQHAHQKGVIHRDIKPTNVMVTTQDGRPVPKVIDFGIAKATQRRLTEKTLYTDYHQLIGTPQYMSPEQAEMSDQDVDTRSDIYSLGVLLYELLVGTTPFDPEELHKSGYDQMCQMIRETEPATPSKRLTSLGDTVTTVAEHRQVQPAALRKQLRGDLDSIVMKALEKDRSRRYDTAHGLARDIERCLSNEPVLAQPPSKVYRLKKFVRKYRVPVTASAAVLVALVVSFVLAIVGFARARHDRQVALHDRQVALTERNRANEYSVKLSRQLYVSDMNVAQQAWEEANVGRVLALLNRHRPTASQRDLRSFEWYYLWRLCARSFETPVIRESDVVLSVAFSPDGTRLAAGLEYGHVTLFGGGNYEVLERFGQPGRWGESAVAFSPDGKRIAYAKKDGAVGVWDIDSRKDVATLNGHSNQIGSIMFSPDGEYLAFAGRFHYRLGIGNLSTSEVETIEGLGRCVAFSSDGKYLASGGDDNTVKLCVFRTRQIETIGEHTGPVLTVAFSPDGKQLASGSADTTARIWDLDTGRVAVFDGHRDEVRSVTFSPDGSVLASASRDNSIRLWDVANSIERDTLKGHSGIVQSVAFSPDGTRLASGSQDYSIRLWDIARSRKSGSFTVPGHSNNKQPLAFSPDPAKTILAWRVANTVKLWNLVTGRRQELQSRRLMGDLNHVAISKDGIVAAAGAERDTAILPLWHLTTGRELQPIPHAGGVTAIVFSPDGTNLAVANGTDAVANGRNTVELWTVAQRKLHRTLRGHTDTVGCVTFSPNGEIVATAGKDRAIILWDVRTGDRLRILTGHNDSVLNVAFSPDGKTLASGSFDNTIKLWQWETQDDAVKTLKGHSASVHSLFFLADGRTLVSGGGDRTIRLWDMPSAQLRFTIRGHTRQVNCVVCSPDEKTLVSWCPDGTARVWRAASQEDVANAPSDMAN